MLFSQCGITISWLFAKSLFPAQEHTGVCNLVDPYSLCPTIVAKVSTAIAVVPSEM